MRLPSIDNTQSMKLPKMGKVVDFNKQVDAPKKLARPFSGKFKKFKKVALPPKATPKFKVRMPSVGGGLKGLGGL